MPFLALITSHMPTSHLSSPIGLSSMIVPTFTENCLRGEHALQVQTRRLAVNETCEEPQRGQITLPSGQRIDATNSWATSGSAKYRIASTSVFGNDFSVCMRLI